MLKHVGNIAIFCGTLLIMCAAFLTGYNIYEGKQAEKIAEELANQLQTYLVQYHEQDTDISLEDASIGQNLCVIDDTSYIGILDIPALQLTLPVCAEFSYANLKKSPCIYQGNLTTNNMVIAGHNYERHFGQLKYLNQQDQIILHSINDVDRLYYVLDNTVYDKYAIDDLLKNDEPNHWDLTLFTCTLGGENRYIIRCKLVN